MMCPARRGHVDLRYLFRELAARGATTVLIEGGSEVIGAALREKLIDKMIIFIAPKIIGDQNAISAVRGLAVGRLNRALKLRDISIKRIKDDLLVEGTVCYTI